jgi:hypothetical protein
MKWIRRQIAYGIWAIASWFYPYADQEYDSESERGWDISLYIEATEEEANEVFSRVSDAVCGVPHHHLDTCPGPMHVMGMRPCLTEQGAAELAEPYVAPEVEAKSEAP